MLPRPPFDPTRYPFGVGTADDVEVLGDFGMPDPTHYTLLHDDFLFAPTPRWVLAGAPALADGAGGLLQMAAATGISTANKCFATPAGLRQFIKARLALGGATAVATVGLADATTPTTGMYATFNGNGTCTLFVGTATATFNRPFVLNEQFVVGVVHDPVNHRVVLYVNGKAAVSLPDSTLPSANLLVVAKATTAAVTLDYILVAAERDSF